MITLTEEETDALLLYTGIIAEESVPEAAENTKCTLNVLLDEGFSFEKIFQREGTVFSTSTVERPQETADLLSALASAAGKIPYNGKTAYCMISQELYEELKKYSYLPLFLSASSSSFRPNSRTMKNFVLLCIHIDDGSSAADLSQLGISEKINYDVLIAPYQKVRFKEHKLSEIEKKIRDKDGRRPAAACDLYINGETAEISMIDDLVDFDDIDAAVSVFESLNDEEEPAQDDIEWYLDFKAKVRYLAFGR